MWGSTVPRVAYTSGPGAPCHQSARASVSASADSPQRIVVGNGDGSSGSGNRVMYGACRIAAVSPGCSSSNAGAATANDPHSICASEIATCAIGTPELAANAAEAYSHGSRSTRSGSKRRACSTSGSNIAVAARRPNRSRLPMTDASVADATVSRSRNGAISASEGSPPRANAKPSERIISASAGGATTSTSSPRSPAPWSTFESGIQWPAPPSEHAASTRTGQVARWRARWSAVWVRLAQRGSAQNRREPLRVTS